MSLPAQIIYERIFFFLFDDDDEDELEALFFSQSASKHNRLAKIVSKERHNLKHSAPVS